MLNITRKTGLMDVGRLGAALQRPGMDTRTWVSYAAVQAIGVDAEGVFVDVILLPTMEAMTARMGTIYAGPGYGFNIPIGVNDEVIVGVPSGDPQHGPVVLARMQSASDTLPQDAQNNPNDLVLVVQGGVNLRINVSGGGKAYIGSTNATDAAVLGTTYRGAEDTLFASLSAFANGIQVFTTALNVYLAAIAPTVDTPPNYPTTANMEAAAIALAVLGTALAQAIATFEAQAPAYLSQKVNVG